MCNDDLYGHNEKLLTELDNMTSTLINIVKTNIENLENQNRSTEAEKVAKELLTTLHLFSNKKVTL